MKKCFKCENVKPLSEFYKHAQMADGHLNKCKECAKKDSTGHRNENLEKIRSYDRARGNRQPEGYLKEWREKYPNKYKAHTAINNAIRGGRMKRLNCEICGAEGHAHHDDYAYPLTVRWLCPAHHHQWHAKHGEALNPF